MGDTIRTFSHLRTGIDVGVEEDLSCCRSVRSRSSGRGRTHFRTWMLLHCRSSIRLCVDEQKLQNRVKAGSDNEEEGKSSTILHHVASSSSPGGGLRATTPPPASLRATAQLDPAQLKPGCKVSGTSKYKLTKPHGGDYCEDPKPKPKQRVQSWFGLV
jgi:hypothetical protein